MHHVLEAVLGQGGAEGREQIRDLLRGCRAFLFPGLEDFGIAPVEALSAVVGATMLMGPLARTRNNSTRPMPPKRPPIPPQATSAGVTVAGPRNGRMATSTTSPLNCEPRATASGATRGETRPPTVSLPHPPPH